MLDATQQAAVSMAQQHPLSVITGGPGTGKTTIIRELCSKGVALAAPTGKAARRLTEQTGHRATTIHRLLGWQYEGFLHHERNPLPHHTVVVDEASMLDVEMAAALFLAVGKRLVLVGDVNQLPSVGPGKVLRDVIDSKVCPVTRLTRIYRQGEDSYISVNAHRILNRKQPVFKGDFLWHGCATAELTAAKIADLSHRSPDAQVLCPQRTGPCGVAALNLDIQQLMLRPKGAAWKVGNGKAGAGDRLMQTNNDYEKGVMNGELGTCQGVSDNALLVKFGDGLHGYNKKQARSLVLAYATTVHKSQGSEYDHVIIACHSSHSHMLSRSLLYTAITRGKKLVELVGNRKGLAHAIRTETAIHRRSGLKERLAA